MLRFVVMVGASARRATPVGLAVALLAGLALAPSSSARSLRLPGISGFSPGSGVVGTIVAVSGGGFTGATSVTFNGVAASFSVVDDADIQATVPSGATSGKIGVTTPAGSTTSAASFRVLPVVSGFSPGWGWPGNAPAAAGAGTQVTIAGSAFTGATAVTFHGVSAAFTVDSYGQITATVPGGATTGKIRVTTKTGTASSASAFDVLSVGPGWPQFGYDNGNTAFNPYESVLSPANVSTLQLEWHDHVGKLDSGARSAPSIVNGIAYVGSRSGSLYAMDARTGLVLWTASTGREIYSTPAVVDGVVYVGSQDFNLYAFDADTGQLLWSTPTGWYVFDAPAVADGTVYVDVGFALDAFDARSGILLWSAPTGNYILGSPAVANGLVYVGSQDSTLYAFDASSGAMRWSVPSGGPITVSAVVANGLVCVRAADGGLDAYNAATGALRWHAGGETSVLGTPAIANGTLYIGSRSGLYAFDASTGNPRWHAIDGLQVSTPAVANGVVYAITEDGAYDFSLVALDADTGSTLANVPIVGYPSSSPVVANARVYVGTQWKLTAYGIATP